LVLNGHHHVYSRFAPMDPSGNADPRQRIATDGSAGVGVGDARTTRPVE
jgi:hypothetical protein